MDMLRFDRWTAGRYWVDDYGYPAKEDDFRVLRAYSPYHNIRTSADYPAILVTTADTDDRVVPAHSFKYAAALQAANAGAKPHLIRIETRAGHGSGKPGRACTTGTQRLPGIQRRLCRAGITESLSDLFRHGARQGRTSLPGHQATVRSHENAVSRVGKEPGASVHPIRARQPVPRPTTATGMRTRLSEIGIDAAQAAQTARKSLETVPVWPHSALKRQYRRSRSR